MEVVRLTVPDTSIYDQTHSGEEYGQASSIDGLPYRELTEPHYPSARILVWCCRGQRSYLGKLDRMCCVYWGPEERAHGKEG